MNIISFWVESGKETEEQKDFIYKVTKEGGRRLTFLGVEYAILNVEWNSSEGGYTFKVEFIPLKIVK